MAIMTHVTLFPSYFVVRCYAVETDERLLFIEVWMAILFLGPIYHFLCSEHTFLSHHFLMLVLMHECLYV